LSALKAASLYIKPRKSVPKIGWALIILSLYLEVSLWVIADGALLWCLLANHDMTTVRALPDDVAFL
jgi:hypothetical protein